MPNSKLEDKIYKVPPGLQQHLGDSLTYGNIKMKKNRLSKDKEENIDKFNKNGGNTVLNWIEKVLSTDTNSIKAIKKIGMDTGRENQFIKTHEKNSDKNPTSIGSIPKINNTISSSLVNNRDIFKESYNKDVSQIKRLITYMNNKTKK